MCVDSHQFHVSVSSLYDCESSNNRILSSYFLYKIWKNTQIWSNSKRMARWVNFPGVDTLTGSKSQSNWKTINFLSVFTCVCLPEFHQKKKEFCCSFNWTFTRILRHFNWHFRQQNYPNMIRIANILINGSKQCSKTKNLGVIWSVRNLSSGNSSPG